MSVRKVKDWIEILSKMNPEDNLWALMYSKEEVGYAQDDDSFVPTDEHWDLIVNDIGSDYAFDTIHETFTDAIWRHLNGFRCGECYNYDYEVKDLDGQLLCKECGEETDVLF